MTVSSTPQTQNEELFTGLAVLALLGALAFGAVSAVENRYSVEYDTNAQVQNVR